MYFYGIPIHLYEFVVVDVMSRSLEHQ